MRIKNHISLLIVTLGVLAFLLRPYMVYQLTSKDRLGSRAFSILQRPVKKKDEHHEYQAETGTLLEERSASRSPIRRLLVHFVQFLLVFSRPLAPLYRTADQPLLANIPRRYVLTSCLLI